MRLYIRGRPDGKTCRRRFFPGGHRRIHVAGCGNRQYVFAAFRLPQGRYCRARFSWSDLRSFSAIHCRRRASIGQHARKHEGNHCYNLLHFFLLRVLFYNGFQILTADDTRVAPYGFAFLKKNLIMCLCPACANNFYGTGSYYLRRVHPGRVEKDICTYCGQRPGFDYEVVKKKEVKIGYGKTDYS